MDRKKSLEQIPPDHLVPATPPVNYSRFDVEQNGLRIDTAVSPTVAGNNQQPLSAAPHSNPDSQSPDSAEMGTLVAHSHVPNLGGSAAGINKRYRPAPAKTFQCRGYGECRMVFSRSEHLARHIRKHTGERPFTCHCGKQFSRLDNLRQHAQTVHADKQDQNERMMRDLTSLHATMAAANKAGHSRGGRRSHVSATHATSSVPSADPANGNGVSMNLVKQEDLSLPMQHRPGTSTGYEGDHNNIIYQGTTWHVQTSNMDRPTSRPTNNHSFRDPGQSFLAPSSSNSSTAAAAQTQSFLPYTSTFNFSVPDAAARDGRPGSNSARPPTSGGAPESHPRSLPPLSAVVSATLPSPPSQSFAAPPSQQQQPSAHHVLPFPPPINFRRPPTATRPGTAPASASLYAPKSAYIGGPGLVPRSELSFLGHGRGASGELGSAPTYDAEFPPSGSGYDSPFSFHPPALADSQPAAAAATTTTTSGGSLSSSTSSNPRKRAFAGPDGPGDDIARLEPNGLDYDYGSESRPQSRRLSVMELCNDPDANAGVGAFLLSGLGGTESRPNTSSGLVTSASALAIVDRESRSPLTSPPLRARAAHAAAGAAAAGGGGGAGPEEFGGGGVSSSSRHSVPSPTSVLSYRPGATQSFTHSPTFSTSSAASYSPRSSPTVSPFATSARSSVPSPDATAAISRRGSGGEYHQHDQVRVAVPSHSSSALGMRV